ncbi:type I restriction-modification system subunit M [Pseudomonadota bacterium]|nr:type I restriction-modification system subunit M [Pseudomonadota bacterium]
MNYDAAFKNIDDTLWKDAGCGSELDYIEQTSWILFLKYLDDLEKENKAAAELSNKTYEPILSNEFSWATWAAPKKADGSLDYNAAKTGDDLKDFVNTELFPYLKSFKSVANDANTLEYKIGQIFSELSNKLQSGYSLREVINKVNELQFLSNEEKHELSSLYEDKIKNMGNAGRNGGEYYTPRPLIQAITQVVNPVIGDKVYDGAVGSAGFLCEAYSHILNSKELSATEFQQLQTSTLYGKEKKSLAYVIGTMNMILHGIEAPNILHGNTLGENIADIQEKDRVDVVLANPPFGGKERAEVQQNFPIATSETAYLFLQHFIKMLKVGGRAGVVIKNTFLSNTDNASIALRKQLIEECNLYAILDLPGGTFTGAGVKTVVLFFNKGTATKKIWYYQLNVGRNMGKTNPLNQKDMAEFVQISKTHEEGDNSWVVDVADINKDTYDLTVNNPNTVEEVDNRTPQEIIAEIEQLDAKASEALKAIKELL